MPAARLTHLLFLLQEGTQQLVDTGRYDTRDDFTVVVQPFLENVDMPRTLVKRDVSWRSSTRRRHTAVLSVSGALQNL